MVDEAGVDQAQVALVSTGVMDEAALRVARAIQYGLQACQALANAHVRGIVHRDLKPENLFIARESV